MPVQAGQVIAERYRLVRPIGKGAQASVWIAEHLALGSQVAVKLMDPELVEQGDAKERFRREAAAAAQLRSAHVVQILDHGIDGNQPFMVMELLDGEDLWQRLERKNRLTLAEASVVVTQIARALARAHAAGIVHRDLKPENVYLVPNEDDEIAKVLDFGVAKFLEAGAAQRSTSAGTLLGTPHYMSPEQVRGVGEIDHRSDLWALGVIAYQLTVGDLPFESEGVGDLLIKITMEKIPTPSKVRSDLPKTFDTWFAKACHRDVEQRFQTARELAEALARVAGLIPAPADSLRGVPAAAKGRSEPPAFDVDFEEGASLPPPPPPPPPAGAAAAAKEDVDEDWPDEPPPPGNSVLPPAPAAATAAPAIPPPPKAPGAPPRAAPARPIPAPAARAMAPTEPAIEEVAKPTAPIAPAKPAAAPTAPTSAPDAARPAPAASPPPAAPPPPRAAPPARAVEALPPPRPRPDPAPASTSDAPPRSKSPLSSTISGASGDVLPPPELDGSRKKRALTYVLVAAVLGAAALTFAVVRSHGTDAPPAPASGPEPVRPRDPPAVVAPPEPPPTPSSSASAVASGAAVDPGQSQRPIKNDPNPSRPAPPAGGARPKRPPANNGEIVIEVPLPEREVPVPPSP